MKKNNIKYLLMLCLTMLFSLNTLFAQNAITVQGTVVDEEAIPLIGVSVSNESRSIGTVTNVDGEFTLNIEEGTTLLFTYVGYNDVRLTAEPVMQVQMGMNAVALDAITVVGVGYGTMRKSDLTGSISSVSADDFKQGVITSTEQLLQGKVAGLSVVQKSGDPTEGSTMRLRGGTSLTASNSPLVVVDGIPGVDMNTVQANEIVSIDVLKDASAAAIYGSRGANGVIIVTTNRQNAGRQITYNGYIAISNAANNIDLLSADQYRAWSRENNPMGASDFGYDTDWQKEIQQTAVSHSHNVAFSSGSEKNGLNASITYQNTEGIIKTSELERLGASVNVYQYGLNDRLKVEAGIHANVDNFHPVDMGIYEKAYNLNPTLPVKYPNGAYSQLGTDYESNPVEMLDTRVEDPSRHRLLGYAKAELEIMEGLKAVTNLSYEFGSYQNRLYLPNDSYWGSRLKGQGQRTLAENTNKQLEFYLAYDKAFKEIHRFNAVAGYSYLEQMAEGFGAIRHGFDTNEFTYNNLAAGSDVTAGDVYSYKNKSNLISFFGRVNYTLMDKYMITATLRGDGSSKFGDNNKWGIFPSVSAAWRISDEDFMAETRDWLDNLKLRVGYGVTGNQDAITPYASLATVGPIGVYYDGDTDTWKKAYGPNQNANPDLKWESTSQTNVGIDINFLHRFNVTIEGYIKKTTDLLYVYPVDPTTNQYKETLANAGELTNKGIEFTIGANIMKTNDFSWNANLTLAYNDQQIDKLNGKLGDNVLEADGSLMGNLHGVQGFSGINTQILKEGYPVGVFWGPKCSGIDENGHYIFNNLDENGQPVNEYLGSAQPKLNLGFSMDFTYRDFDLAVSTYGMFGQKILNAQQMQLADISRLAGGRNVTDDFLKSGIVDAPKYSSYWIEKGDFFRLQSLTLGYTLPISNEWFKRVRFYVTGENLFVLTNYSGLDPEVNIDGMKSPGIDKSIGTSEHGDNYFYPRPRTFSFGLNLVF